MDEDLPAITRLAIRQHGIVTRQQLLNLGLGSEAITYRVRHGRLFRVHPGVYAVGRPTRMPLELASAAVLACGPGAALCDLAALALWGFRGNLHAPFDVAVRGNRRPTGIKVHRLATLDPGTDLTTQRAIRVTSPARTVLDCAPKLDDKTRARTINDALRSGYLTRSALQDVATRNPHHPGTRLIAPLASHQGRPTRSPDEDEFPAFCVRNNLPVPLINVIVDGVERDAYFPEHNLIVELDGWDFHNSRQSFEADRTRDADALANGTPTVRITHDRMKNDEATEAARLHRILSRGSAPPERPATP
jgi:hypothetical protein